MTTDPIVRRFNPAGPNYGQSGLDRSSRALDRKFLDDAEYIAQIAAAYAVVPFDGGLAISHLPPWQKAQALWLLEREFHQRGAVSLGGSVPRAASEV